MRASYRDHQNWVEGDDDGDRDCVLGVRDYGLRGLNGDTCACRLEVGGRCRSPSMRGRPGMQTNDIELVHLGGAISAENSASR